jgi:hypothetical protein
VPYYSNPLETHPIDEAISIANNKAFNVIQIADTRGIIVDPFSGSAVDAFSRLRTSEAFTLADYKHVYGVNTELLDELSNGGTVTHVPNSACVRLTTTSNTSSRSIHQSRMYHNYMPGKSQLVLSSFVFYAATANVTKRTGYFDDRDGIFFEQDGNGVLSMNVRSYVSGSAVTTKVPQSAWNGDRCDGTGDSGWNLDITKTQLWWCDFQWLGVGRVRVGFVHEDSYVVAHTFYHSDILDTVYLSNPNLPIRCEIRNTGTTSGAYFDQICSTVISEGGYTESGINFGVNSGTTLKAINTVSGVVPILAIRLKNTFQTYPNRVFVRAGSVGVYASGNPVYWSLIKLPGLSSITLSSSTWTSAGSESAVEYNLTATAFTGGYQVAGGIVGSQSPGGSQRGTGTGSEDSSGTKKNFIAQNYGSTDSEIYVVCAQAIGGNATAVVDLTWREIS